VDEELDHFRAYLQKKKKKKKSGKVPDIFGGIQIELDRNTGYSNKIFPHISLQANGIEVVP